MRRLLLLLAAFVILSCGRAQKVETIYELRERVYDLAKVQAVYMDSLLTTVMAGPDRPSAEWCCPRTFQGDTLVTSDIGWWTSGFYPGVLWQIYEETKDPQFRELAEKHTLPLADLLDRETDHDIGFQLMSSFGKMCRYTCPPNTLYFTTELVACPSEPGDSIYPMTILARGADKLAARFVPEAGVIRSWNRGPWNIPVIIDNMMNLELLKAWGHGRIADKHAVTTARNHFREDGTVWHLVDYADDGSVLGKQTVQGYADDTAWARGQAWALYGYAMMAEYSNSNPLYLRTAWKLADWIQKHLPEDGVPYWDFSQSDFKDASAAAIIACGLLKVWKLNGAAPDDPTWAKAWRIIETLASPEFLAEPRTNGGFLLKHSVGNLPSGSEVDVPLTYADYYFLEALSLLPH